MIEGRRVVIEWERGTSSADRCGRSGQVGEADSSRPYEVRSDSSWATSAWQDLWRRFEIPAQKISHSGAEPFNRTALRALAEDRAHGLDRRTNSGECSPRPLLGSGARNEKASARRYPAQRNHFPQRWLPRTRSATASTGLDLLRTPLRRREPRDHVKPVGVLADSSAAECSFGRRS
jgi:hypothetical protein